MVSNLSIKKDFIIKVQEEFKSFLSIIMGVIEDDQQGQTLEYFRENATSLEDISLIEELQKSMQEIERKAQEYYENIGVTTHNSKDKRNKKNISYVSKSNLDKKQNNIDIIENELEDKHHNDFDIEL